MFVQLRYPVLGPRYALPVRAYGRKDALRREPVVPRWPDAPEHDAGVALVELLAYAGDLLSYHQDRVADESRLRRRRFAISTLAAIAFLWCWRRHRPGDR